MGIFRFFVCLFLLLLSSASLASDIDNDGLDPLVAEYLMAVGNNHACTHDEYEIICWGDNQFGQLDAPEITQISELVAGKDFNCAIHNNTVSCWGYNGANQTQPPLLNNPVSLALGTSHACVIDNSEVICWGDNLFGQIEIPELSNPTKVSAGSNSTCALASEGIVCWGAYNSWDYYHGPKPEEAVNPSQVSVGSESICFLDNDVFDCVEEWGLYDHGPEPYTADFRAGPIVGVDELYSSGESMAHCIRKNNELLCYGEYDRQIVSYDESNPVIHEATGWSSISIGSTALCFFSGGIPDCVNLGFSGNNQLVATIPSFNPDPDGDGVANDQDLFPLDSTEWLDTDFDGIGNNADSDDDGDGVLDANDHYPLDRKYSKDTDSDGLPDSYEEVTGLNKYLPADASMDSDGDGLSATVEFTYGTSDTNQDSDYDGLLDSWEVENQRDPKISDYQVSFRNFDICVDDDLGFSCFDNSGLQSYPPNTTNHFHLSVGVNHSCAIDDSGVICWGLNNHGQIDAPLLLNPISVEVGFDFSCAIDNSEVICWGNNEYGQINVPTLSNPTQISVSLTSACALDDSGVICWGGDTEFQNTPELNNPKAVATIGDITCALDNSELVCWGSEIDMMDIPVINDAVYISSSYEDFCAIRSGPTIQCWGWYMGSEIENFIFIDPDSDGYSNQNGDDAFPTDPNEWLDTDLDGIGNNADTDDDGDNVLDAEDLFPLDASEWADTDNDGLGDNSDNCPQVANDSQEDMDADEIGDQCDADTDGDGVENTLDVFPFDATEALDSDTDGIGNNADPDDDNDGFADINDDLPLDATEQLDTDADGIGNNTDNDDDGDGIEDGNDAFPLNSLYSVDSDNDGMADAWELLYGLNPNDSSDTASDQDDDGAVALQEFIEGTLPVADADNDGLSDNYEVSIGTDPNNADSDNDGVNDKDDMFPLNSVETNDTDLDGVGDLLDPDANGDGIFENHVFTLNQLQGLFLSESRQATIENDYFEIGVDQNGLDREILWRIPITEVDSIIQGKTFSVEIEIEEKRNFGHYEKDLFVGISDGAKVLSYFNRVADHNHMLLASETDDFILNENYLAEIEGSDLSDYKLGFDFYDEMVRVTVNNQAIAFDDNELVIDLSIHDFDVSKQLNLVVAGSEGNESFAIKTLNISYPDGNVDLDQDGIPNDYETANGLNPVDASDAQSDSDMDGLTALEEYNLGTSLTNNDTDRDTLPDGWEVENGRDPLVADYQISPGYTHSCIKDDSGLKCWGNNNYGQSTAPALDNVHQIEVGGYHSCALDDSGVVCWGRNDENQIDVPELNNPKQISLGWNESCALDDDGVNCWGRSGDVPSLINPSQITVSQYNAFFCAIDDSSLVCWGNNEYGQTTVPNLDNPTDVSLGWYHSCAIDKTGVVCWGKNDEGQTNVPELSNPIHVSAGRTHTCAIDDTGVVCWGDSNSSIHSPINISPTNIYTNAHHTCVLDEDGFICNKKSVSDYDSEYLPELLIDPDEDGFSSQNGIDIFPLDSSEWQDTDLDGIGNNADLDDDNDGFEDTFEIQNGHDPLVANLDIDNDGIANVLDADNDNDGIEDDHDAFPIDSTEHLDTDLDGIGNNTDVDDDGDGVSDALDLFPFDLNESADTDGDGAGDNADFFPNSAEYSLDSDLDQMPDAWERKYGLNPTDASDALLDQDDDGLTALEEYEAGTIPLKILDIDADGNVDALTDGLIILRYLFNLRGDNLVNGAIADNAMRTEAADIEAYIQSLMPSF